MIGCECATCRSTDPRDRRLRPSIFVDVPGRASILVDSSPDLRQQALAHGITRLDGVLYTHSHADHILGLDEMRRFNVLAGRPLPCYADHGTWDKIRRTFYYVFDRQSHEGGGVVELESHVIDGPFDIQGVHIVPVPVLHGTMPILGFRFGSFAYLTDCSEIPVESFALLAGVETLVIDALRRRPHPTHFSLDEAVENAVRLGSSRTYLTHMCHDLAHAETNARLPDGIELAYDGLSLDVAVEVA
jgi:phosphoribosyl 1,2-cyclic phosphate phosphodiesterase